MASRFASLVACMAFVGFASAADKVPQVGDAPPDIPLQATQIDKVLPDSKAKTISLKDFKGKKNVVLFYFPKAMTPGCTLESCGFRDLISKFDKADTVIIGFSPVTLDKQEQFTKKENLNFPLIADPEKKLITALGVKARSTWVIDKEGKIVKIYEKVSGPGKHPQEVFEVVEKLK